eukprot:3026913-Pyramimonas_sp.AAC.1
MSAFRLHTISTLLSESCQFDVSGDLAFSESVAQDVLRKLGVARLWQQRPRDCYCASGLVRVSDMVGLL